MEALVDQVAKVSFKLNAVAKAVLLVGFALLANRAAYAQLNVTLISTLASPQLVGQSLFLTATVSNPGVLPRYRFMVQPPGASSFNMVVDYSLANAMQWSSLQEGAYQIQVLVTDMNSGQTGQAVIPFQFTSRITGLSPVVSPSSHPLVAIYSAPPCSAGTIQVAYQPTAGGAARFTNTLPCQPGQNSNFYVAGMRQMTSYTMWQKILNNGRATWGPPLTFQTGRITMNIPAANILVPPGPSTSTAENLLMESFSSLAPGQGFGGKGYPPTAYSLYGVVLWYYPTTRASQTYMTRPANGGTFLLYTWSNSTDQTVVREVDLAGNTVRETNAYSVSQQLAALGLPTINWMSHEAMRLPSGHTLVLGMTERVLTDVQGPGPVDVVGDMIVDLDANFQVSWTWNTFDHLPNSRTAILGETCTNNLAPCGPLRLGMTANDWTHCNSLALLPDGNLVLSIRNQDWVVKINYQNGTGDGQMLWTLGNMAQQAGTPYFALAGDTDPSPWFSHQHDVEFDGVNFELFDNGNTRVAPPPIGLGSGNSRGQAYSIDETNLVATQLLSADLGSYSAGFGSAQLLANGNYWFCLGFPSAGPNAMDAVQEVGPTAPFPLAYSVTFPSSAYRSFRLSSLYSYPK